MSKAEPTRDRIMDAALNIFSTKGYHDTRMDEIVEASATSKGSIYFHFPNKGLGTLFEKKRLEVNDRFALLIKKYLDEAIQVGEIVPVDTEIVSYAWMGAIYGIVIRWVYTGEPDSERILQSMLPLLLKSVGYEEPL